MCVIPTYTSTSTSASYHMNLCVRVYRVMFAKFVRRVYQHYILNYIVWYILVIVYYIVIYDIHMYDILYQYS